MDEVASLLGKQYINSFKRLGNNAIALNRHTYITEVRPNISNYVVTDKADGERAFLIVRNGEHSILTATGQQPYQVKKSSIKNGVFDCEFLEKKIYIFDVLKFDGENVSTRSFSERLQILRDIKKSDIIVKEFHELSEKKIKDVIKSTLNTKYKIDGLIFTSLNESYNSTINYKWKPPENLTIDFLVRNNRLCVGMSNKAYNQYGFRSEYINSREKYFPVPFVCSLGDYSDPGFNTNKYEGRIIELSWNKKWVFHRIRIDREQERSNYFGNDYRIAELTLQTALNPLTLADLTKSYDDLAKTTYFKKSDDTYKIIRKYNNMVKRLLIKNHSANCVIDLASGKGQDMKKYLDAGIKELTMVEIDKDAIDELIKRKYDILNRSNRHMLLHVINADLTRPFNIKKTFDAVFCNFAFHYLLIEDNKKQICETIAGMLNTGGEFIFTSFDGKKVKEIAPYESEKYSITFLNPKVIMAKLPCSDKPYPEPIVDFLELDKLFIKHNMLRIETGEFKDFLNRFEYDKPDEEDMVLIGLYSYNVYKKMEMTPAEIGGKKSPSSRKSRKSRK
jgi:hypothetical protein